MSSSQDRLSDQASGSVRESEHDFVSGADTALSAIVYRLVEVIERASKPLDAAVKWHRLTFAADGDFHHWLCGIAITRRTVALVFHFGGILDDPDGCLIAGTSKFLRKLEFRSQADVDTMVVLGFVEQAIDKAQYFKDNWKAIQSGRTES